MGISKILRSPSVRTQFEASLTGIVSLLLASLGTTIYLVAFTEMSGWFKFLTIIGEIGLFLLMGSSLVGTYTQYYVFKKTMGLYPPDEELNMKLEEAKQVRDELNELIEKNNPIEENVESI